MRVETKSQLDERQHPHLTREKFPALQKLPAFDPTLEGLFILSRAWLSQKWRDLSERPHVERLPENSWHAHCPS